MKPIDNNPTCMELKQVLFHTNATAGSEVFVAGTFNNWDDHSIKLVDPLGDGNFYVMLMLTRGTFEYKYIINGTWQTDPEHNERVINAFGTFNNVIVVE